MLESRPKANPEYGFQPYGIDFYESLSASRILNLHPAEFKKA